ncbi:MAG: nucleotidyltransferase domain-containing protein [Chloroflexota bacterium]
MFHARITNTPSRRNELLQGEYTWEVGKYGEGEVAMKIVDALDEEWVGIVGGNPGRSTHNPEDLMKLRERCQHEIDRVVSLLREHYRPDKIILFGSAGRGEFGEDSDLDLLIVKDTDKRPVDRMREVYALVYSPDHYLALDPLVYTPREFSERLASGDAFIQEIVREGKVLYEQR